MTGAELPPCCARVRHGLLLRVKVVPGASRTRIVGPLGDHLKVQIAAPPAKGQANDLLLALLQDAFGGTPRITAGAGSARKQVLLIGVDPAAVSLVLRAPAD